MTFKKYSTVPLEVIQDTPEWLKKSSEDKKVEQSDNTSDTKEKLDDK